MCELSNSCVLTFKGSQAETVDMSIISNLQVANLDVEVSGVHSGDYLLARHEFAGIGNGKYSGESKHTTSIELFKRRQCYH